MFGGSEEQFVNLARREDGAMSIRFEGYVRRKIEARCRRCMKSALSARNPFCLHSPIPNTGPSTSLFSTYSTLILPIGLAIVYFFAGRPSPSSRLFRFFSSILSLLQCSCCAGALMVDKWALAPKILARDRNLGTFASARHRWPVPVSAP